MGSPLPVVLLDRLRGSAGNFWAVMRGTLEFDRSRRYVSEGGQRLLSATDLVVIYQSEDS